MGKIAVFIGQNHRGELLAEVCVNKFNGLVGQRLAVHVQQCVLEDGARHGHVEIVARVDSNLNRVGKQDFLAVVQLSNHVVGARQQTGLVEGALLHHWTGKRTDALEQTRPVERSCSDKLTRSFEGFALRGFSVAVGPCQR